MNRGKMTPLLAREKVDFYRWKLGMMEINKEYHQHYIFHEIEQYLYGWKNTRLACKLNYRTLNKNDIPIMLYETKIYKIWRPIKEEEYDPYIGIVSKYYYFSLESACHTFVKCDKNCGNISRQCIDCREHTYRGHTCPLCQKNICYFCQEGYHYSDELCDDCSHSIYTCNICANQTKKFKICLEKTCHKMICISCIDQSFYCKQHQSK